MKLDDKEWRIESDLRTMREYAEICADPKRKKAALKLAGKEAEQMYSIASGPDKREMSDSDKGARKAMDEALENE